MQTQFWHERWQSQQIGFHQDDINSSLQEYWPQLELPNDSTVFVPLCGKSRDMLWFAEQGYQVIAIELSELAVAAFFEENQLPSLNRETKGELTLWRSGPIAIYCGDFFALSSTQLNDINAVYDRASLVALPPSMRQDYAQHLAQLLPGAPKTLLITLQYDQNEMDGPPFSVSEEEVSALFSERYQISKWHDSDALPESPRFKAKGLTALREKIYCMQQILA